MPLGSPGYGPPSVLPVITLTVISVGSLMRYTRTNMLEVLNADYIRTARAKGLSEHKVIYHHAFRNTLIPLVTIVGGSLPGLFSGALITETLFSIPGVGYTSYQAMVGGGYPLLHVLSDVPGDSDPAEQSDCGCGSTRWWTPACALRNRKEGDEMRDNMDDLKDKNVLNANGRPLRTQDVPGAGQPAACGAAAGGGPVTGEPTRPIMITNTP